MLRAFRFPLLVALLLAVAGCGSTVVPEGAGTMSPPNGCPTGPFGGAMIEVPAPQGGSYCVDATEVTNAEYGAFLASHPSFDARPTVCLTNPFNDDPTFKTFMPKFWPSAVGHGDHPVVGVNWCAAATFCAASGKRLCGRIGGGELPQGEMVLQGLLDPSVSEWFNACSAGGTKPYSYGSAFEDGRCVFLLDQNDADMSSSIPTRSCEGGYPGLFDLGGSVGEFINLVWWYPDEAGPLLASAVAGAGTSDATYPGCNAAAPAVWFAGTFGKIGIRCCADRAVAP